MTTTLPAIPGLIRRGSPLKMHGRPWLALGETDDRGRILAALPLTPLLCMWLEPRELSVDLGDQTGFGHAMLWLGAKYGAPLEQSLSFHAAPDPTGRWSYPIWTLYADGYPVCSIYDADPGHPGFGPSAILIKGSKNSGRVEALRLAVLAVAGVQG